jgi:hypothetical protein
MTWTKQDHEDMERIYLNHPENPGFIFRLLDFTRRLVDAEADHADESTPREILDLLDEWDGVGGVE